MAASDVLLKPAFVSPYLDGPDATKLQPSEWNAARLFSGGVDGQIVTRDSLSPTGATFVTPATLLAGYVLGTRTVNGHVLSADVTVTKADVGLSAVENTALSTWAASGVVNLWSGLQTFNGGAVIAGAMTTSVDGIAVTPTDGIVLANATAATAGVPVQQAPDLRLRSHVWNTTATAADNTQDWMIRPVPTSGAAPSGSLVIAVSLDGGAATYPLIVSPTTLTVLGSVATAGINGYYIGTNGFLSWVNRSVVTSSADGQFVLRNGANTAGVGLDLTTDAILKIRTRAQSADASLTALNLTASGGLAVGTTLAAPNGVEGYFVSTSASDPRGLMSAQYSTDAIGARLHLRKGRGTEAVPTTIVTGDVLGRVRFSGYDSANFLQMASIDVVSTGTIAATRVPTYLAFSVATDATPSVLTEVLRLTPTGITSAVTRTITKDAIAVTATDGLVLQNTTAATAGIPVQQGPDLRIRSQVWNTTATAATNTDDWILRSVPISGATPSGLLKIGKSLNGGATTFPLTLTSGGVLTLLSDLALPAGAAVAFGVNGTFSGAGADGKWLLRNNAGSGGFGLDATVADVFRVRTRAHTGYATVDALGYSVSGVAGASKTAGPVTSITVVNGIVTACT